MYVVYSYLRCKLRILNLDLVSKVSASQSGTEFRQDLQEKTRASMLAYGPLSDGFIIDKMLKILVWDDFKSNYQIGC